MKFEISKPKRSNILRDLSLGGKIAIIVLVTLSISCGAMFVSGIALHQTVQGYEGLIGEQVELRCLAQSAEINMLQCRRNEKDFLLRKDTKYLAKLQTNAAEIIKAADEMERVADQAGETPLVPLAQQVSKLAQEYRDEFEVLVGHWTDRGLDHESGCQGEFRIAVKTLEGELKHLQLDDLYIGLLNVRRYEKDYHRTKSDKYRERLQAALVKFCSDLEEVSCTAECRQLMLEAVDRYQENVTVFVDPQTALVSTQLRAVF